MDQSADQIAISNPRSTRELLLAIELRKNVVSALIDRLFKQIRHAFIFSSVIKILPIRNRCSSRSKRQHRASTFPFSAKTRVAHVSSETLLNYRTDKVYRSAYSSDLTARSMITRLLLVFAQVAVGHFDICISAPGNFCHPPEERRDSSDS
jgi:hypothetical protein